MPKTNKVERATLYHLEMLGFDDCIEAEFLVSATPTERRAIEVAMRDTLKWADEHGETVSFKFTDLPYKKSTPAQVLRAMREYREEVERENEPDESIIKD